jgi:hypothetical protein
MPVIILSNSPDRCGDVPTPPEAKLILPGLAGDKLGNVVGRHRRMHRHYVGQPNQSGDRSAVANEIERKLLVERRVDGVVRTDEGDRVAIGYRAEHRLHAYIAARPGPVLDDELLPQMIRQILADNARDDVVGAARRKTRRSSAPAASDSFAP